ncbi:MAG: hypothetical protein JWN86_3705 [Planctomycetota bacterium]|nr:hypothetical protein [Planctomycetota bacterium]
MFRRTRFPRRILTFLILPVSVLSAARASGGSIENFSLNYHTTGALVGASPELASAFSFGDVNSSTYPFVPGSTNVNFTLRVSEPDTSVGSAFTSQFRIEVKFDPPSDPGDMFRVGPLILNGQLSGVLGGPESSVKIHFDPPRFSDGRTFADGLKISGDGLIGATQSSSLIFNGTGGLPDGSFSLLRMRSSDVDATWRSSSQYEVHFSASLEVVGIPEPSTIAFWGLACLASAGLQCRRRRDFTNRSPR